MLVRLISHAVTVVPRLEPIIRGTAWPRAIMPELTKLTAMTLVAVEDWMTIVTRRPTINPRMGLAVMRVRKFFI